jgi:hypothetical protein
MRAEELSTGFYKIKSIEPAGRVIYSRDKTELHEILQVRFEGSKKLFSINNGPEYTLEQFMKREANDYQVIARIQDFTPVVKPTIVVSWQDDKGAKFSYTLHDAWGLRNFFLKFKFLTHPFNFKPLRRNGRNR